MDDFQKQVDDVLSCVFSKENMLYDINKGIIKRVNTERLQLPMRTNSSIDSISNKDKIVNKYYVSNNKNNTIKELMSGYYVLEII